MGKLRLPCFRRVKRKRKSFDMLINGPFVSLGKDRNFAFMVGDSWMKKVLEEKPRD